MASVRCPGCGAKNPEGSVKCRICGFDLRGQSELPMSQPKAGSRGDEEREPQGRRSASPCSACWRCVLAGVLLGVLPGGDVLTASGTRSRSSPPRAATAGRSSSQTDARFSATMPVDRTEQQPFQWSTTGTHRPVGRAPSGPTTTPTPPSPSSGPRSPPRRTRTIDASLTSLSIAWAESLGGQGRSRPGDLVPGLPGAAGAGRGPAQRRRRHGHRPGPVRPAP